jgi:GNAT superfamily N-acetyltransferase
MPSLRRLSPTEIDAAHAVLAACGLDLQARFGFSHWVPPHPIDKFRSDASERQVYAILDGESTIGTFTLGPTPRAQHPPGSWFLDDEPAVYLNRLAILPSQQRRGLGAWAIARVEELAVTDGARAIRCDAIASFTLLIDFYRRLGFQTRDRFDNRGHLVVRLEKRF